MLSNKQIFDSQVIETFLQAPSFGKGLMLSDKAKLQVDISHYKQFSKGVFADLPYQAEAVQDAYKDRGSLWSGEIWTGGGKSYIAALISLEFLKAGKKTIFICPNRTGMGTIEDGILNKFFRAFNNKAPGKYSLGAVNETDLLRDVFFFTPQKFIWIQKHDIALFEMILDSSNLLIVDEAHHFPKDENNDLAIYGEIKRVADKYFTDKVKKVVALTATYGRGDGKLVVGKEKPDYRISVYDGVQMGYCPEIHGQPVYLKTKAPKAVAKGGFYDLKLKGIEFGKYLQEVVGAMIKVQQNNLEAQFCAFVLTVKEARYLAETWNKEAKKLNWLPIAVLVGEVPEVDRQIIKEAITARKYAGFVTCHVGSESLDIPALEIVHLIRRTRSINMLVQSVGRALRLHETKRRALVVDYNVCEARLIRACKGLEEYAVGVGAKPESKRVSGGPLIAIEGTKNACFEGVSLSEERCLVLNELCDNSYTPENKKEDLLSLAYSGAKKPIRNRWGSSYGDQELALALSNYTSPSSKAYDPELSKKLHDIAPGWFARVIYKPGMVFGLLTLIERVDEDWSVQCKCGHVRVVASRDLLKAKKVSFCRCRNPITPGLTVGELTVICETNRHPKNNHRQFECLCSCGKTKIIEISRLRNSTAVKSCGHLALEALSRMNSLRSRNNSESHSSSGTAYSLEPRAKYNTLVVLPTFKCLRCGHAWHSNKDKRPHLCAFCHSPYWDLAGRSESVFKARHKTECKSEKCENGEL